MIPGEYRLLPDAVVCNAGRASIRLSVVNTGDRPVQVGSHFHFFEVNRQMAFDRALAYGRRLDIPAGTAVRFEPGEAKEVDLVEYAGKYFVIGFNNLVDGSTEHDAGKAEALKKAQDGHFKTSEL
jgi:urease subunit beta